MAAYWISYDNTEDKRRRRETRRRWRWPWQWFRRTRPAERTASITTTHLGCDACRWPISFVNVHRATVPSVLALRSFPEAAR